MGSLACGSSLVHHVRQQHRELSCTIMILKSFVIFISRVVSYNQNRGTPAELPCYSSVPIMIYVSFSYTHKMITCTFTHIAPCFQTCGLRAAGIDNRCSPSRALKFRSPQGTRTVQNTQAHVQGRSLSTFSPRKLIRHIAQQTHPTRFRVSGLFCGCWGLIGMQEWNAITPSLAQHQDQSAKVYEQL